MTEEQKTDSGLVEELHTLGQQLATAVKALWDSEESRKLREEIGEGFLDLGQQVDTAIKSAQESEPARQFSEQVKDTMDRARESDVAGRLEEGLAVGLRELNEGIANLVSSLEPSEAPAEEPEAKTEAEPEAET